MKSLKFFSFCSKQFLIYLIFFSSFSIATPIDNDEINTTDDQDISIDLNSELAPIINNQQGIEQNSIIESNSDLIEKTKTAKIIALNKVTAKSTELTIKPGESKYFYNMEVKVHKCLKDPNPYKPNNYILVTITEHKIDDDPKQLFQGWINSSNISIATLIHPIYEIFAKDCN